MIKTLTIRNFKSVKELKLDCRKINLFIGEPNTGKSNILEALGLLSWCGFPNSPLKDYVRFSVVENLFYDGLPDVPVIIEVDGNIPVRLNLDFADSRFYLRRSYQENGEKVVLEDLQLDHTGMLRTLVPEHSPKFKVFKYFKFKAADKFIDQEPEYLKPSFGTNLFSVVMSRKKLRQKMGELYKNTGLRLVLKPQEYSFELQKTLDDFAFSYPYSTTSETLQRLAFYLTVIESNENSVLILEEPAASMFPSYAERLGNSIAMDLENQYFIATHNLYLVRSILEKAHSEDIRIFVTFSKNFETRTKVLSANELDEHSPINGEVSFNSLNEFLGNDF